MRGAVADKVLAPLAGKPVFAHTVAAFYRSGVVDTFIVTYRDQAQMIELSEYAPTPTLFVPGGRERQDSVAAALAELPDDVNTSSSTTAPARSSAPSSSSRFTRLSAARTPSSSPTA